MLGGVERGQSELIGFILVFGVVVALVGINQVFLVPQANQDVEAQHDRAVQGDMVELRSGITMAASSNQQRTRSVRLGTDYPPRLLGLNPPPAAGTIRTVEGGNITVNSSQVDLAALCGVESGDVDTRFLRYDPSYNEFRGGLPITVENTVVHRPATDDALLETDQAVVKGDHIRITRVVGDFRATGAESRSVDLLPSSTAVNTTNESLNLTLPTELSQADWEELLSDETADGNVASIDVNETESTVEIEMAEPDDQYVLECTTVGVEEQPDVDPPDLDVDPPERSPVLLNPTGNALTLENVEFESGSTAPDFNLTFNNNQSDNLTLKQVRVPFLTSPGGGGGGGVGGGSPDEVEFFTELIQFPIMGMTLQVGAPLEPVNGSVGEVEWTPGENQSVYVDGPGQNSGFALELQLEDDDGERYNYIYFVAPRGGGGGGGPGGGVPP